MNHRIILSLLAVGLLGSCEKSEEVAKDVFGLGA